MLGGSQSGYARLTRRWWAPVRATLTDQGAVGPPDVLRLLQHALAGEPVTTKRGRERGRDRRLRRGATARTTCVEELERFRDRPHRGLVGELPLLRRAAVLRGAARGRPGLGRRRRRRERELGVTHLSSRTGAARVGAGDGAGQARPGRAGLAARPDRPREARARPAASIVNIEYPLGLAAYNILREITTAHDTLRGVYVLGKAATLNADVGDVLISGVIHDEHSGSTYWLDNAFSFDDIAPYLVFGSGLDNQRAVTVKSTFLQNRNYLDFYYREAYTVVEMEAGPVLQRGLRDRRRRPLPERRGGQLLQAPDRPRDHPLRLRHAVLAGAHARRPRAVVLRDGLDLRVVGRDHAPDPARWRACSTVSRAVLVTGASRGIGAAAAARVRRRGATASRCTTAPRAATAEAVLASLPGDGHVLAGGDLADPGAVRAMVDGAAGALGSIDVLVNNAGVVAPHADRRGRPTRTGSARGGRRSRST